MKLTTNADNDESAESDESDAGDASDQSEEEEEEEEEEKEEFIDKDDDYVIPEAAEYPFKPAKVFPLAKGMQIIFPSPISLFEVGAVQRESPIPHNARKMTQEL